MLTTGTTPRAVEHKDPSAVSKTRFAFLSENGRTMSYAARLMDEGYAVKMHSLRFSHCGVGSGIIPQTGSVESFIQWANDPNCIIIGDDSSDGFEIESFRADGMQNIYGDGVFIARLRNDLAFASQIAASLNMSVLDTYKLDHISEGLQLIESGEQLWEFFSESTVYPVTYFHAATSSSMVDYLLYLRERYGNPLKFTMRRMVIGVRASVSFWFTGETLLTPIAQTVQLRHYANGDQGPVTSAAACATWFCERYPKMAEELQLTTYAKLLAKMNAPPGEYTIDALCTQRGTHFLGFRANLSAPDSLLRQRLLVGDFGQFLITLPRAANAPFDPTQIAMGVQLSSFPHPLPPGVISKRARDGGGSPFPEIDSFTGDGEHCFIAQGVGRSREGRISVQDPEGIIGLISANGSNVATMRDRMLSYSNRISATWTHHRTDFAERLCDMIRALDRLGYDIPNVRLYGDT